MASERATVPPDVFVSDLYKPSVDYKDDGGSDQPPVDSGLDPEPSVAPEPEAMDIDSEPPAPDDLSDWRYQLLQRLTDGTLPQIKPRHDVWPVAPRPSYFSTERCTSVAPQAFLCAASPVGKESNSSRTYTRGLVVTMLRLGR